MANRTALAELGKWDFWPEERDYVPHSTSDRTPHSRDSSAAGGCHVHEAAWTPAGHGVHHLSVSARFSITPNQLRREAGDVESWGLNLFLSSQESIWRICRDKHCEKGLLEVLNMQQTSYDLMRNSSAVWGEQRANNLECPKACYCFWIMKCSSLKDCVAFAWWFLFCWDWFN